MCDFMGLQVLHQNSGWKAGRTNLTSRSCDTQLRECKWIKSFYAHLGNTEWDKVWVHLMIPSYEKNSYVVLKEEMFSTARVVITLIWKQLRRSLSDYWIHIVGAYHGTLSSSQKRELHVCNSRVKDRVERKYKTKKNHVIANTYITYIMCQVLF